MTQIIIWSLGHFVHNQYSSKWTRMRRKWIPQVTGQQERGTGWQASWKAAEKVSRTAIWSTPRVLYKSKLWDTYSVRNFQLWKQFVVIPVSLFLPSHQGCVQACRLPLTKQIQLYHLPRMEFPIFSALFLEEHVLRKYSLEYWVCSVPAELLGKAATHYILPELCTPLTTGSRLPRKSFTKQCIRELSM